MIPASVPTMEDLLIANRLRLGYIQGSKEESAQQRAERNDFERMRSILRVRQAFKIQLNHLLNVEAP